MSVFKQKDRKAWTYKFVYRGETYKGSTGQLTREDAEAFELREQQKVRRIEAGLGDLRDAPYCQEWAGVYYTEKAESARKVKRPDQIDVLVRVMLQFFGRRPKDPDEVAARGAYHDLTLADPIVEPEWLDRFEDWMAAQRFSGSHRNHLRTQVSGMYRVAMLPKFRKRTGVTMNPMQGVPRDRRKVRTTDLSTEQVRAWIAHASYHVRLAMAIAALGPKLRRSNVLGLEWAVHLDKALTRITITDHKTDADGRPIIQEISAQLRDILEDARRRQRGRWVVAYRGKRVKDIRGGVMLAAERAGIPYGRDNATGATFHTLRHAVATWFAEMDDLSEPMRAALLAHADIGTTQGYTHLRPLRERRPLERLSSHLALAELVKEPWTRWTKHRTPLVPSLKKRDHPSAAPSEKSRNSDNLSEDAPATRATRSHRAHSR